MRDQFRERDELVSRDFSRSPARGSTAAGLQEEVAIADLHPERVQRDRAAVVNRSLTVEEVVQAPGSPIGSSQKKDVPYREELVVVEVEDLLLRGEPLGAPPTAIRCSSRSPR